MIREMVISIREAVKANCYLPALALALALPDILGQEMYPDLQHSNGRRDISEQYKTWFNEWVMKSHYYLGDDSSDTFSLKLISENNSNRDKSQHYYFDGAMCYRLRCSFLHSGNYAFDLPKSDGYNYQHIKFELRINASDSTGISWKDEDYEDREAHVTIDIGTLCNSICDGVDHCLRDNPSIIEGNDIKIIDLKTWKTDSPVKVEGSWIKARRIE
ncbi:MAG: hypothetical protein LKJ31_06305 [Atopobiaceae bacterium]|jgi:hypothetical protein|nr:hypothetical protein [Atopobiaceae bacterium]